MVKVHERTHPGHHSYGARRPRCQKALMATARSGCALSDSRPNMIQTGSNEAMLWHVLVPPALLLLRGLLLSSSTRNQEEPMYGVEQRRKRKHGSAWSYFWAEELPSWPPALPALGPTMALPVWAMCMNFAFPKMKLCHTALHTDFEKEKHSPVKITRIQMSNFYVCWEQREIIQYILLLFLLVLTWLLTFRHY